MKEVIRIISALIIGVSIIVSSTMISNSDKNGNVSHKDERSPAQQGGLITEEEAAQYLSLSYEDFKVLVSRSDSLRKQRDSYDTYEYIPYMTLTGKKYFSKLELEKWIAYHMVRGGEELYKLY